MTEKCPSDWKFVEKHIHNLILHVRHLNNNTPHSQNQWGFSLGKLTTTALLSFTLDCQQALDSSDEICPVFFNLSKAFDKVSYQCLFKKFTLSSSIVPIKVD